MINKTRLLEFEITNQQDSMLLLLYISTDALHVSGGSSANHQEYITVYTASGIVNQYCCLLLSWIRSHPRQQQAAVLVDNTWSCMYSYVLLMMGGWTAWNMQSVEHLIHANSKQQYWLTIPEAVCTVLCSWWLAEEPPETCRTSVEINKSRKVAYWWL